MPIGYLETVGPVALFTVAVLWPPRRPAALARVVFVLTHLLNEAPAIGWIWLLTSTALAVTGGQLASAGGAAVAALAVFTAAGLVEVTRRGLRTSRAVDHALNRGLGPALPRSTGRHSGSSCCAPSARWCCRYRGGRGRSGASATSATARTAVTTCSICI